MKHKVAFIDNFALYFLDNDIGDSKIQSVSLI